MSNKMKVTGVRKDPQTGIEITSLAPIDELKLCKECKNNPRTFHSSRCAGCKAKHTQRKLNENRLEQKIKEQSLQKQ